MKWLLIGLLVLGGCTKEAFTKHRLKISFNTQPATTDPRKAGDFVSSTLVCMIYEGLTRCLSGDEVEPALAERVVISKDKKVYVFHLRKAWWTDGTPITAYDFEKSWKGVIYPASSCAFLFYPIKNAERCAKGELSIDQVGIKALDSSTLQVELEQPTPYFYSLTAFPSFLPVASHAAEDPSVCSGPFWIEKMVHSSEIILKKNPSYWNAGQIALDEVHISIVPDEMTALQMFERGDLDWLGGSLSPLPPDALCQLEDRIHFIPSAATTICTFNTQVYPFNNASLRKAFSYAIDRDEIVGKVAEGGQTPASSILPPVFSDQTFFLSDPIGARLYFEMAIEELQIAPKALESLTLYFRPGQVEKRLAQTLQRQWKDVFGITINLIQLDFKSHAQRLQSRDYHISLASWIAQFNDPMSILQRFKDGSNLKNYAGWQDIRYINLLNEADNSDKRRELLEQAETFFACEMPITPIYHWRSPSLSNPIIESVATTPCGGVLFEKFKLNNQ
jgi:oligopeptide transport system substrate-binding protein